MEKINIAQFCKENSLSQKQYYDIVNFCKQGRGYRSFQIPKKNGGVRLIDAPCDRIKYIQYKVKSICESKYHPKKCCHGFAYKRSCVTNASNHINKKWCLNFDLLDFFPSINFGRIFGLFKSQVFNYDDKLATTLAIICCYNKRLPQGAPSSPILANMIANNLDKKLIEVLKNNKCTYTRYADDITISTNMKSFPSSIVEYFDELPQIQLSEGIRNIIKENGFNVNQLKTRLSGNSACQMVTGIVVNKKLNLKRKYYRILRAILHNCKVHGLLKTAQKNGKNNITELKSFILGKLAYYKGVVGEAHSSFNKLCKMYNQYVEYKFTNCVYTLDELKDNALFVLEKKDASSQGTAFLANNKMFTCRHCFLDVNSQLSNDELLVELQLLENQYVVYNYLYPDKKYKIKNIKVYDCDVAEFEILEYDNRISFKLNTNSNLNTGDELVLLGFPNYSKGDTPNIQNVTISSQRVHFDFYYYTIDKYIVTGSSGGPVINSLNEVIGIATNGANSIQDATETDANMFYPFNKLE